MDDLTSRLGDLDFSSPSTFLLLVLFLFLLFAGMALTVRRLLARPKQPKGFLPFRRPRRGSLIRIFPRQYRLPAAVVLMGLAAIFTHPAFRASPYPAAATAAASYGDATEDAITCDSPDITDGDTFRCGGHRIRLASIDAPEMPGHCRAGRRCVEGDPHAAKDYLESLTRGPVTCHRVTTDHYGRTIARCEADGRDLSCAMVEAGHAIERYGSLSC